MVDDGMNLDRFWWDEWSLCKGKNRNGKRCRLPVRKGNVLPSGEIFVPFTCVKHIDQEESIKRRIKVKI